MRTRIVLVAVAVMLAAGAAPAAGLVHTLQVEAHGQCEDGSGGGGGGSVYVFPFGGEVDAVDAAEAQSVADGIVLFASGSADEASQGNPGGDACPSDDTDGSGQETHGTEDHVSAEVYWLEGAVVVGACYDDEGFHTTADCHDGSGGDLPSGSLALP